MGGSSSKTYFSGNNTSNRKPTSEGDAATGNGGGSSGGGGGSTDACNIVTSGTLRSPNPAAVAGLAVGTALGVQALPVNGVDVLQAVNAASVVVGVIDTPDEQPLLECISLGNRYQATVKRIAGGAITVGITRI